MRPKANNIFLTTLEKNTSPLLIPPKYQYRSREFLNGRVVAIGRLVTEVEVGDEVAYNKDAGIQVEVHDQKYIVIKPAHIIAVV